MPLTNLVNSFPDPADEVMEAAFPEVTVDYTSGFYHGWSKSAQLELLETTPLGDDSKVPETIDILASDQTYQTQVFAVRAPIGKIASLDAAPWIGYEQRQAMAAARKLKIQMRFAAINNVLRDPGQVNGVSYDATNRWDGTGGGSAPIDDIINYVNYVERACGREVTDILFTKESFIALQLHPDSINRAQFVPGKVITAEALEKIVGVKPGTVKIQNAQYRYTRNRATPGYRKHLGADVAILHSEAPSLESAGFGYTFAFGGFAPSKIAIVDAFDQSRGPLGTTLKTAVCIAQFKVNNPDAGFVLRGVVNTANTKYAGYLD